MNSQSNKTGLVMQSISASDIVDFILKNCDNAKISGLYDGKAGLSIALFVAANYLQDEKTEDIAFNLIQESLVIKNNDLSFENGLPGIGYALLYLIENKYFDANFDDVFGTQYKEIIRHFENIDRNPSVLVNQLTVIYFLSKVDGMKDDRRIKVVIKKIFEGLELFLTVHFLDFYDIRYLGIKVDVINIFKTYLKLVDYSGYAHFSRLVLEDYASLYRKGKIASSLETGYYLNLIANKYNVKGFEDVIQDNISYGAKNTYPCTLSLREKIDMAKLVPNALSREIREVDMQFEFRGMRKEEAIRNSIKTVDERYNPFGYGNGLSRILIYSINKNTELL